MPVQKQEKFENVEFEEAIEIAGYGKFSVYIIFLSGMTVCSSFLSSLDISFLMPAAECDLELTSENKGLLGSAYFIGVIAVCHLSGFLADTLGRRYILLRGLAVNVLTYIFGCLSPNFWTLFIFKVISGIASCPCMIATMPFLGEFVPERRRSQAIVITGSLSTVGLLYSSLIAWVTLTQKWEVDLGFVTFTPWRLFYLLCGLPSLMCAVLFCLTPESPKFLLIRGKKGDTMKVLQRVHSVNSGTLPQNYPVQSVSMDADDTVPPLLKEKGAAVVLKNVCDQTLPLLKPPYLRNLLLCVLLFFVTFFCVNSIFLWLPEVTNRIAQYKETHSGRFYLCEMLTRPETIGNVTADTNSTEVCEATINTAMFVPNLIIAVAQPIILLGVSLLVPYVDVRLIITMSLLLPSGMGLMLTRVPDAGLIMIILGGMAIFIGITFTIVNSILVKVFPTYIRAMAASLTMITGRLGSIAGSQLFSQLIDSQCSLLFHLISLLLLCCATTPFLLKLKNRKQEQSPKGSLSQPGQINT